MRQLISSLILVGVAVVYASILLWNSVLADHDKYRFKWPYTPDESVTTTSWPYAGYHICGVVPDSNPEVNGSCTDAWDFVIPDDDVIASAEGVIVEARNTIDPTTCLASQQLGNYVKIRTSTPTGDVTVSYGHFESTPYNGLNLSFPIRQGDHVGVQGYTGHTVGSTPYPCGTHLHWQFDPSTESNPGRPSDIDGVNVSAAYPNTPAGGPSTNSRVGDLGTTGATTIPSLAIRAKYLADGITFGGGNSWSFFGWTADLVSPSPPPVPQVGCAPSNPYCQLYVHYEPDPQAGHWGSILDFRKHPENVLIGGTTVPFDADAIMSGRWDVISAYTVRLPFYLAWLYGDTSNPAITRDVGLPLMDEIPGGTGQICGLETWSTECCPASALCAKYQRFSHGYIWKSNFATGIEVPVFCPDVAANPGTWPDYTVDLLPIFSKR